RTWRCVAGTRAEAADRFGAVGRHELHPCETRGRSSFDRLQDAVSQPFQHASGFRCEVLGARLVPREAGAVEQQDPRALPGQEQAGDGSGGAGADDTSVPAAHERTKATHAPVRVAARFTTSLSTKVLPWTVAPKPESTNIPASPAHTTASVGEKRRAVSTAMKSAPPRPPAVPSRVTPPSVP